MTFERRIEFVHAKNWRREGVPGRDYGHCGMSIHFAVVGPAGAVSWSLDTEWYVSSSREEWERNGFLMKAKHRPGGIVLAYHSPKPMHEGHEKHSTECDYIPGGSCYCDGSYIAADKLVEGFLAGGTEWLWPKLEAYYRSVFEDAAYPDFTPVYDPHPDDRTVQ